DVDVNGLTVLFFEQPPTEVHPLTGAFSIPVFPVVTATVEGQPYEVTAQLLLEGTVHVLPAGPGGEPRLAVDMTAQLVTPVAYQGFDFSLVATMEADLATP